MIPQVPLLLMYLVSLLGSVFGIVLFAFGERERGLFFLLIGLSCEMSARLREIENKLTAKPKEEGEK